MRLGISIGFPRNYVVAGSAPTYNGLMPNLELDVDVAMTPASVADYVIGADLVFTSETLPTGLSVNADTGVISGTPTVEATTAVTVVVTNGGGSVNVVFDITVGAVVSSATAAATTAPSGTDPIAAADIGAADAGRVVYVATYVPGVGLTSADLTINTDIPTLVGNYNNVNRSCEYWSKAIAAGTTAALDRDAGDSNSRVAAFRVIGYQPIASSPVVGARQEASNATGSNLTFTVPANGCALVTTKNYETITPDSGSLAGTLSSANDRSAVWFNETASPVSLTLAASTETSTSSKYIWACIMELI